jgi:hypothetical protein
MDTERGGGGVWTGCGRVSRGVAVALRHKGARERGGSEEGARRERGGSEEGAPEALQPPG